MLWNFRLSITRRYHIYFICAQRKNKTTTHQSLFLAAHFSLACCVLACILCSAWTIQGCEHGTNIFIMFIKRKLLLLIGDILHVDRALTYEKWLLRFKYAVHSINLRNFFMFCWLLNTNIIIQCHINLLEINIWRNFRNITHNNS